jgi:hypothetical protein
MPRLGKHDHERIAAKWKHGTYQSDTQDIVVKM